MISIFTPVHGPSLRYIQELHRSLLGQTNQDWEWVILANGGAHPSDHLLQFRDKRIQVKSIEDEKGVSHNKVGRLKKAAATLCNGEVLMEVDADDILTSDAIDECLAAFVDPRIQFAYSNCASFDDKGGSTQYSEYWGWKSRPFRYDGKSLIEMVQFPPTAHAFRRIEFSPNHFRAWRRSAYMDLGGHNERLESGDDHEIMIRTYLKYGADGIAHIDEPLYLQRVHDHNTSRVFNAVVQQQVSMNYIKFITKLAARWADDMDLLKLDLGGAINPVPGFEVADILSNPPIDLNQPWKWEDNSVGVINCRHTIEHLTDPVHFFTEAYRVLANGGWLLLEFPSATGKGAFRDPTHKSFLVDQTLWYFTRSNYARYAAFTGRFQVSRIEEWNMEPGCPVVTAELFAVKGDKIRFPGELLI